jgi:propionaldehyde dehydrogenase
MNVSPGDLERIVSKVLSKLDDQRSTVNTTVQAVSAFKGGSSYSGMEQGIFADMDSAVNEAMAAQKRLVSLPLSLRNEMIANIRRRLLEHVPAMAELSVRETGLGKVKDKVNKITLAITKTPGTEVLSPVSYSGDDGLTLVERAPYGVLGAITPSTNPAPTIINNGIGMIASGNSVVFNPHPGAKKVSQMAMSIMNQAVVEVGGPACLLTTVAEPTLDTSHTLMYHKNIKLLVVTGGGAVVKAAFAAGKKVIAAGPGNPPVVVDETADIRSAAKHIVDGASFDNNVLCIAEKEIIAVSSIADELLTHMKANGAYQVIGGNIQRLERLLLPDGKLAREFVGQDVAKILAAIGITVGPDVRMAVIDVPADHPFVFKEMLMPVLPLVRVSDVDAAISLAVKAELGHLHTAMMHSMNLQNLHKMARAVQATIFVKNGPSYAGLGFGGEGYTTMTIAGPTGEGITNALTFTRERRCVIKDYFRIV